MQKVKQKGLHGHRHVLVAVLAQALQDPDYDFQAMLEHDPRAGIPCPPDGMKWPSRAPFADIYRLALQDWRDDLTP